MSKHTPGPWKFDDESKSVLGPEYDNYGRRHKVCRVHANLAVSDANAILIAAAPELLEAAQAAESVLARQKWRPESTDPEAVALFGLRAAIAKATGG